MNKNPRRDFLKALGFAILTLEVLPTQAHSFSPDHDDPENLPTIAGDQLVINSGLGFIPHRHDLLIPMDLLTNPPAEGVQLKTTLIAFHYHVVELNQQQLFDIQNGNEVDLRDSTVGEHMFKIYLPKSMVTR